MFSDPVSFTGDTRVEVITVLANCGRDTDRARRALVTWIRHKQEKGRSTEHILTKLRDIESKFLKDTSLHGAFRDARAETFLPKPDLPPPPFSYNKRASDGQIHEYSPSIIRHNSTGRASISSSPLERPANLTQQTSPPATHIRFSRDFSQVSDIFLGRSNTGQRRSLPQVASRISQSRSPQIQIPHGRSLQSSSSSPITSSPEESESHLRYRYVSRPVGLSSRSSGLVTPVSASPPEFPLSPMSSYGQTRRRMSHGLTSSPPSARVQIPHPQSQRTLAHSPPTPSSDEPELQAGRYRALSQSSGGMSQGVRRVTPPRTSPPVVPLPPIPSNDQSIDSDSDNSKKSLYTEYPPTPVQSLTLYSSTPTRPLPIQPIPSPVPGPEESENGDLIDEDSLQQSWEGSTGDLPSDIVVRQDSPVYMFHKDPAGPTGISRPPPHIGRFGTYPPDMPILGYSLGRAVDACGGSPEVRLVVSKCIGFHPGFEPPYWQTRLQACGLGAEAVKHLVDEMCKEVDWAASFRRAV